MNPDAVAGFAAQPVHRIGIIQCIGNAAVFTKIQSAGNFVLNKINSLGSAQVVYLLLVASQLAGNAGIGKTGLEGTFFLKIEKGAVLFIDAHQSLGRAFFINARLPVFRTGAKWPDQAKGRGKGQNQAPKAPKGINSNYAQAQANPCG